MEPEESAVKSVLVCRVVMLLTLAVPAAAQDGTLHVRVSWGHTGQAGSPHHLEVVGSTGVTVDAITPREFEAGDVLKAGIAQTRAGGADVDGLDVAVTFPKERPGRAQRVHVQWTELVAAADADTARRLTRDPAFSTSAPALTFRTSSDGTSGFTVTVQQLIDEKAMWIPSADMYITAGDVPVPFEEHTRALAGKKGTRVLDVVAASPEATYADFTGRWADMGSPGYVNPHQIGPGHIVGVTWDSAIHKFGIDRAGGVWPDDGNPDKFRFWFAFADLAHGVAGRWRSQRLHDGLPVLTTTYEQDGVRYELEQFAYPLQGPPEERRGDVPMVLLQQLTVTELQGVARTLPVSMAHRRQLPPYFDGTVEVERRDGGVHFRERGRGSVMLALEGEIGEMPWGGTADFQRQQKRIDATVFMNLPAKGARTLVVKLPSPMIAAADAGTLAAIDYASAREATLQYWSAYVDRGASFTVPEKVVNDLFRASLWHALRLPRRHGGAGRDVRIDLPYSNFAYGQTGTPWPVNQAVYVDYMLYDLRGYHGISNEELEAQFRNNQEADGHVSGYANWLVYTPSMLYSVAQNYLLSDDREAFDRLLPQSIRAMDWCLGRLSAASSAGGAARGLVRGPLNDNTGDGVWAFNQAYLFAGLDLFARALERHGHPRAAEARDAARTIREAIGRGFGAASTRSPVVQLRDGTWSPYVPAEALTPQRLLHEWYPTDVDTGATHLLRLKALPAQGALAEALLHDHEDNLYYKGWGMAQEPIYNQQATAYLLRDEPEAVVRAFYSYLGSAFSHSVLEPVEHHWGQGQYFGPPSTDGAWFELYRHMLIHERDDDVLVVGQATPRAWLRDGQRIDVQRAPTYYGPVSATVESRAAAGEIQAEVQLSGTRRPAALHLRLRHPDGARLRSVTVNGQPWTDLDVAGEWVKIPAPTAARYQIVARY
jgi:hypothetical protein